jgi:hypothetical protein
LPASVDAGEARDSEQGDDTRLHRPPGHALKHFRCQCEARANERSRPFRLDSSRRAEQERRLLYGDPYTICTLALS